MAEKLRKLVIRTEVTLLMGKTAVHFGHGEVKLNAHGQKQQEKKITQEHPHN